MKIISFSSYTSTWYFTFKEAIIAHELRKKGHEVLFITSGNEFPEKSKPEYAKILRKEFDLRGHDITAVLTDDDRKEINVILHSLNKNNFESLIIDEIFLGKIALFEFLLRHKKISIDFTDEEWTEALVHIQNTLISFFACRKIIAREKPDRIIMFSSIYSVNHAWERYAHQKGIPVYFLENGMNVSDMDNTLIVAKNDWSYFINVLKDIWPQVKNIPVPHNMLQYVTRHFLELLRGTHYFVYSAPKSTKRISIRKFFNIGDSQKVLVATMSSYDEILAGQYVGVWHTYEHPLFETQAEWIRGLIEYVKNRPDLFLIIRVHPREFPNKRDTVKSEHAKLLEQHFNNLPFNIRVNWPTDAISIYDMAEETDVFLNAWSAVGLEMSLLGIPVVIYSTGLSAYPADLNYIGLDQNDYFKKIELALREEWNFDRIKMTYRWMVLYYYQPILRLRDEKISTEHLENTPENIVKDTKESANQRQQQSIPRRMYGLLPEQLKSFIREAKWKQKLKQECIDQLQQHIDISKVEKMIIESRDSIVDVENILASEISPKDEDHFVRIELKKIYNALYSDDTNEPEINSLQYNLKHTIFN